MTDNDRILAGRYRIGESLGRGSKAEVFRATDLRLGRTVAVKILDPGHADDATFRVRFRQEAQAAARMAHPTIVRVFDAGEETATDERGVETQLPFLVMEYVQGRTVAEMVADGPLEAKEAARIGEAVLVALEYAHRAGVVHRDVKPANVMVTRGGQVKVLDFGIARAFTDPGATVAETTQILGTATYFSPEQAKGETLDARADLYTTGVLLFEMLTGRPPFRGAGPIEVAYQHVSEQPPTPSELNPAVSPTLDAVVARALTKNRYVRYQSAAEFREDLELAGSGRIPALREHDAFTETLYGPSPAAQGADAALRQLAEEDTSTRTRNRPPIAWIWAGIACVAIVVFGLLFWVFTRQPPAPTHLSVTVPDVAGMTLQHAKKELRQHHIDWERGPDENSTTVKSGRVIRTDPPHGTEIAPEGDSVTLYVSLGKKSVPVPDANEQPLDKLKSALEDAGLELGSITKKNSPTVPEDGVLATSPEAGSPVAPGTTIDVTVSTGMVTIPDLTGKSVTDASSLLSAPDRGLTPDIRADYSCASQPDDPVTSQSEPPGDVPQGSTVTITYCTG